MSTITPSRPDYSSNKDDYTKRCHYTIRHYTCGHRKWPKPRVTHIGCPESPMSKRRCDNMALKPKDVYTGEVCSQCRPAKSKEMSTDAFDTLIKKTWVDAKSREHISKMAHLASETLLNLEGGERGLVKLDLRNASPTGKTSLVAKEENKHTAKEEDKSEPSLQAQKIQKSEEEERPKNVVNQIAKPSAPTSTLEKEVDQLHPESLLSSVWSFVKPTKVATEDPSQNIQPKNWSDLEEEVDWDSVRDEDNQLWKDKDDWVHVS